ncbi:MAG TPA: tetratricopeptide repeat protein [Terriglobales bacterium]|jgi:tetratricopeptide (TPR) repeat protein
MTLLMATLLLAQAPSPPTAPHTATPAAAAACQQLRRHGQAEQAQSCFQRLAAASDPDLQAEGDWGLESYQQANDAFRQAAAQQPQSAAVRVRWGRLLQERFNDTDAEGLFNEALKIDPNYAPAYLGLALVSADGFDGKALDYARKALTLDPKLAAAHVLLATLALEDSTPAAAESEADAALQAQPDDLDAMAVHAAVAVIAGQTPAAWLGRVIAINPHYGEAQAIIAEQLVLQRRYQDAMGYYQKAVALDPALWSAHSEWGVNLMRLGQADAAEQQLELAYNNGYRDAATVNCLRLLDTEKDFTIIHDGPIALKLDKKEAAVLAPYLEKVAQDAMTAYSAKYHMTLPEQTSPTGAYEVQIEAYPNHADFAVRSVGLPGLGALGVTFGNVVTMDSPSARPPGDFNWASTLRHEMDHVFVLTATHNLVPRWFAEGLAVHEETQANPEWGDRVTPDTLVAIRDHKLLPVAGLDGGFMHPTYPNEVIVSYFQAGRICDYIQERWGAEKLTEMVHDFAVPTTTTAVIQQALGMTPAAFDTQFDAWLLKGPKGLGAEVDNFALWRTQLHALVTAAQAPQPDLSQIEKVGQQVVSLYPDYIEDANAYGFLADAYQKQGNTTAEAAILTAYEHEGGMDPQRLQQLAALEIAQHQPAAAAAALDRINYIYPLDAVVHRKLGDLWMEAKNYPGAMREYQALVDLRPLDQAGAQYDLARAEFADGDLGAARDHVLNALVAAHDFQPAQQLLVQIVAAQKAAPATK